MGSIFQFTALPRDFADFRHERWEDLNPYFDELIRCDLDAQSLDGWLRQWSELLENLLEADARLYADAACDSADAAKAAALLNHQQNIQPKTEEAWQALRQKLFDSGLTVPGMEQPLRRMRAASEIYRLENLALQAELAGLEAEHDRSLGAWRADFEGRSLGGAELQAILESPDRGRREKAWRALTQAHLAERGARHERFERMVQGRRCLAQNAGQASYIEYRFKELGRLDLSPDDCRGLHQAILDSAVPLSARMRALWRRELGVEALRPWDGPANPFGTVPAMGVERMQAGVSAMLRKAVPQAARHFERILALGTLDLADRPGKRYAGFCVPLPRARSSFIYMNANGTANDMLTLAHEAGHAMHGMQSMEALPYGFQWFAPDECNETFATAMELLILDHLEEVYSPAEAARVRLGKLAEIPAGLASAAVVDAFQHWVYRNPEAGPTRRDAHLRDLHQAYFPGTDWSGLEEERSSSWQRTQHIFTLPLYYIEYAVALLGALQLWRASRRDPLRASADLVQAMGLGGTVSSAQLFRAAGIELRLDTGTLQGLMDEVASEMDLCLALCGRQPLPHL